MTETDHIVLQLTKSAINGTPFDDSLLRDKNRQQWQDIYSAVSEQGVLVLCYELINNLAADSRPPKDLHIRWALSAEKIEKRYSAQLDAAKRLAEKLHENGIRFFVLKGLAISQYYPQPSKRECGDIDCFLSDGYQTGNDLAKGMGAHVDDNYYKHSHISYRGTLIENHRFCTAIRGSRKAKVLEKQLQAIIATSQPETILNTRMLIPPADFNAIFLTRHALSHFLTEGINLHHILDWHCFLNVKQNDINWQYVNNVLEQNDMKVFADAMTAICVKHLGLKITNPEICTESELSDKILEDIFGEQRKLNRGTLGKWQNRATVVSNIIGNSWRYREVYGHGIAGELFKFAYGFIFERNPRLD